MFAVLDWLCLGQYVSLDQGTLHAYVANDVL